MGYTIKIGNAVPEFIRDNENEVISAYWNVEPETSKHAPVFDNDTMTGSSNTRRPSYTGWVDFLDATGLRELFAELFASHPGCAILNRSHYDGICKEFLGEKEAPTMEEILDLLPTDKTILIQNA